MEREQLDLLAASKALTRSDGSEALGMLVKGLPIRRTLEAVAVMASHIQPRAGAAVLLVDNERFTLAADHRLEPRDARLLQQFCAAADISELCEFARRHSAQARALLTQASEFVGAIIIFQLDLSRAPDSTERQIDEVRSLATLAIEQKHLAEELAYRAHHDPLTHLWNHLWMEEEIARTLESSARTERDTGLIIVGIDSFRTINEVLGRQLGNDLLCLIAERIASQLEPGSSLARGSGDEFILLVPDLLSSDGFRQFSARLLACFEEPFQIGEHELVIRASVGTALASAAPCDAGSLQNHADTALRFAKRSARGRLVNFAPSMLTTPPERLVMEQHLRFALHKRELEVHYQPQIDLATGKVAGCEALLRWKHPSLGFISPAVFIPIAEEIGLIEEIGEWVLTQALRQLQSWHRAGCRGLRMAVNVSAHQFSRTDLASLVAAQLRNVSVEPGELELEITETAVMADFEHGVRQLRLLRSLGVLIALDDFGTGHSSLAYLQQLPVQRLKIDRMFVKAITDAGERPPLLASIVQMGHALDLSVIAEGAETREQVLALAALQCDEVQGFYFAKPLPPAEFERWIESGRTLFDRPCSPAPVPTLACTVPEPNTGSVASLSK